jgi:outer membrane lipoprotein LolB
VLKPKLTKLGITILLFAAVSACQNTLKHGNERAIDMSPDFLALSNQEKLALTNSWELVGKIAVITPTERKSAYLNWQQANQELDFRLSNLIGVSLLKLTFDGEIARLDSDGKNYQDESTEALIYRATGWILPLDNLPQWIKGETNPEDKVILNDMGFPSRIEPICATCIGWEISYSQYQKVQGIWLPFSIEVNKPADKTRLKFKVSQWKRK